MSKIHQPRCQMRTNNVNREQRHTENKNEDINVAIMRKTGGKIMQPSYKRHKSETRGE